MTNDVESFESGSESTGTHGGGVHSVKKWIVVVEELLANTFMVAVALLLLYQVVSRYLFETPAPWTEEISRYLFVWLIWTGTAYLSSKNAHIAVTFVLEYVSARWHKFIVRMAALVTLVVSGIVAWTGVQFLVMTWDLVAPGSGLPMGLVYAAPVLGMLMTAVHSVEYLISGREPDVAIEDMEAAV